MNTGRKNPKASGFTKTDLLIVMLVCCLLAGLLFAYLRPPRRISSRLTCSVNLKQIGFAARLFNDSHAGYPWAVSTNSGGTREFSAFGEQTFRHFQVLSNDVYVTIGVVCPQDVRKAAASWESLANANVSYFVGLDSNPQLPTSIVAGDRNITSLTGVVLQSSYSVPPNWVESVGLHGNKGHLLFGDGHVEELNSLGLSNAMLRTGIATNRFAVP